MSALDTGKRVLKESMQDDVPGLAAEMSYRFLLALFPMFIVVAASGSLFASATGVEDPTGSMMSWGLDTLPDDAASVIRGQLDQLFSATQPGLLSIGFLTALWAGAGGMKANIKAMNRAYDVQETRPFWRANLVAVGLTLLLAVAVLGGFLTLVVGQFFVERVATVLGDGGWQQTLISLARWPIAIALLIVGVAFLYWAAPNAKLPFRWISPGAILFVLGWLIATAAFGVYVSNFGNYNQVYGTLGGVIVLMLWFYLTNIILLVGAELNAVLAQQHEPEAIDAPSDSRDEPATQAVGGNGATSAVSPRSRVSTSREPTPSRAGARPFEARQDEPAGRKLVTGAVAATVAARVLRSEIGNGEGQRPRIVDEPPARPTSN